MTPDEAIPVERAEHENACDRQGAERSGNSHDLRSPRGAVRGPEAELGLRDRDDDKKIVDEEAREDRSKQDHAHGCTVPQGGDASASPRAGPARGLPLLGAALPNRGLDSGEGTAMEPLAFAVAPTPARRRRRSRTAGVLREQRRLEDAGTGADFACAALP